jgi:hypothetical protein
VSPYEEKRSDFSSRCKFSLPKVLVLCMYQKKKKKQKKRREKRKDLSRGEWIVYKAKDPIPHV